MLPAHLEARSKGVRFNPMSDRLPRDLAHRLREVDGDELLALLRRHAPELDLAAAEQALRNPFLGREGLEIVAAQGRLLPAYEIKRLIALHPRAPEALALRFVPALFWRDLLDLGLDTRVRPAVRRAADRRLIARLPAMSPGEKVALARRASPRLLGHLRHDPSVRVVAAVLENPRLTEGVLLPLVASEEARPEVLEVVARDRRWGVRYEVRFGLCLNPRTRATTVLAILPYLRKADLRTVGRRPGLSPVVKRRAEVLLGEAR